MAFSSPSSLSTKHKPFAFSLIVLLSLSIFFLTFSFRPKFETDGGDTPVRRASEEIIPEPPSWFHVVSKDFQGKRLRIGLVNMDEDDEKRYYKHFPNTEIVPVQFDRVSGDLKWAHLFPEWIDESERWSPPRCPEIPMPKRPESLRDLDVVVARSPPCGGGDGGGGEGAREVYRLQVNLVVANLTVTSGWVSPDVDRTVYVVFEGNDKCGAMREIYRCEDMVIKEGEIRVYKPDLRRLKQKVLMPVGSCQIAPPLAERGKLA